MNLHALPLPRAPRPPVMDWWPAEATFRYDVPQRPARAYFDLYATTLSPALNGQDLMITRQTVDVTALLRRIYNAISQLVGVRDFHFVYSVSQAEYRALQTYFRTMGGGHDVDAMMMPVYYDARADRMTVYGVTVIPM